MNLDSTKPFLISFYRLIDFIVPGSLFYLLYFWFFETNTDPLYTTLGILSSFTLVLLVQLFDGYLGVRAFHFSEKLKITIQTWGIVVVTIIFYTFLTRNSELLSRKVIVIWLIATPIIIILLKQIVRVLYFNQRKKSFNVLLLGENYAFNTNELTYLDQMGIKIKTLKVLNNKNLLEDIDKEILDFKPDFFINNLKKSAEEELIKHLIALALKGYKFITLNNFMETYLRKCFIPYRSYSLDYLSENRNYRNHELLLKRLIDISISLFIILPCIPFIPLVILLIKKQDPGSSIYTQTRVGKAGKKFTVYKFRTMYLNAEFNPYTQKNDDRILLVGRLLRKIRFDEIPQLWNVLRGDLHLFGPRTEWDIFVEKYEKEIPYYHERHIVRPGISGWAQVMYPYGGNLEDSRQKLMYDLYYIKHWSIWLEVETIIRTIKVVLKSEGV